LEIVDVKLEIIFIYKGDKHKNKTSTRMIGTRMFEIKQNESGLQVYVSICLSVVVVFLTMLIMFLFSIFVPSVVISAIVCSSIVISYGISKEYRVGNLLYTITLQTNEINDDNNYIAKSSSDVDENEIVE
jgi:hypothetical protein